LFAAAKKCPFGFETACFHSTRYGTEFDVLKFLSETEFGAKAP